ncbi:MAG: hypothetical protein ACRDIA_03560, partial [Actinomycetota bacterium]
VAQQVPELITQLPERFRCGKSTAPPPDVAASAVPGVGNIERKASSYISVLQVISTKISLA